jgi:hypothetical protein
MDPAHLPKRVIVVERELIARAKIGLERRRLSERGANVNGVAKVPFKCTVELRLKPPGRKPCDQV